MSPQELEQLDRLAEAEICRSGESTGQTAAELSGMRAKQEQPYATASALPRPTVEASSKMRVCHIVLLADLSGSKRSMLEILKHLDRSECDIYVMSNGEGELVDMLDRLQITSLKVPLVRQVSPLRDIRAFLSIYRLCRKYRFDVVHTHSSKTGVLGRIAARLAGVKVVVHHVRGYAFHEFSSGFVKSVFSLVEAAAGRFCDKVIFVNEQERAYSIEKHILPAQKCATILNGVDFNTFDITRRWRWREEIRRQLNIPDDAYVVLFAGRLCEQKNPAGLCETIVSYLRQADKSTYFVILGDGPDYESVRRRLLPYAWSDRVLLLGWQDHVERYMAASDVFLLPSLWEGMPRTILEAMAMGLPVVASDIKGNREAVDDDITGYILPVKSPELFARKLGELSQDRIRRDELGRRGYEKARDCYDSDVNSRMVVGLYRDLLESKAVRPVTVSDGGFSNGKRARSRALLRIRSRCDGDIE
jgi:glycosyltransferase involved in cell wall biosynthesis